MKVKPLNKIWNLFVLVYSGFNKFKLDEWDYSRVYVHREFKNSILGKYIGVQKLISTDRWIHKMWKEFYRHKTPFWSVCLIQLIRQIYHFSKSKYEKLDLLNLLLTSFLEKDVQMSERHILEILNKSLLFSRYLNFFESIVSLSIAAAHLPWGAVSLVYICQISEFRTSTCPFRL